MKNRIDIEEFCELLNIPEFERIIYHKIEELKHVLAEQINIYRNLKNSFKKTAYGHMQIYENKAPKGNQTYRFELDRLQNNKWLLSKIEPYPPEDFDIDDIVPQAIIEHISGYETSPEKIYRYQGAGKARATGRAYVVEFTKYSDHHILGAIREEEMPEKDVSEETGMKIIEAEWNYEEKGDEENFRELFHYMQKYPEIKKRIFGDFFHKAKPKVDSSAMPITLS
jgi:transposase-like protein